MFAWDAVCLSRKTLCRNVVAFHARLVSGRRRVQKGIFGVQPSGSQNYGSGWGKVRTAGRMTWFTFLFGRNLRIRCCNFFNVCTYLFELSVASLLKHSTFVVPEDATMNWLGRSPDFAPSDFHPFSLLKVAVRGCPLQTSTSWNTACMKSYDVSAKSFTRQAYSVSCRDGKSVLIMNKTLWTHT